MKIIDNIKDNWISYLILFVICFSIGLWAAYEYYYPCVSGHYELTNHWVVNSNGYMTPYLSNDFVCDCRTIRDSIK